MPNTVLYEMVSKRLESTIRTARTVDVRIVDKNYHVVIILPSHKPVNVNGQPNGYSKTREELYSIMFRCGCQLSIYRQDCVSEWWTQADGWVASSVCEKCRDGQSICKCGLADAFGGAPRDVELTRIFELYNGQLFIGHDKRINPQDVFSRPETVRAIMDGVREYRANYE